MYKYILLALFVSACTYSTPYGDCFGAFIKAVDLGTDMTNVDPLAGCPNETVTASSLVRADGVYTTNCAFSGCHGGNNTVFNAKTAADLSALVDMASTQTNKMPIVTAGKPEQSYLIYKLNGLQVFADGSGKYMPVSLSGLLPKTDRCKFINWIKQGAKE